MEQLMTRFNFGFDGQNPPIAPLLRRNCFLYLVHQPRSLAGNLDAIVIPFYPAQSHALRRTIFGLNAQAMANVAGAEPGEALQNCRRLAAYSVFTLRTDRN